MDEFCNSYRSKADAPAQQNTPPKLNKVVKGQVVVKKKSEVKSRATSVKNYTWNEIVLPMIKKTILSIVKNGIEIAINGEPERAKPNSNVYYANPSYGISMSAPNYVPGQDRFNTQRPVSLSPMNGTYTHDDIKFNSRADAEMVLDTLSNYLSQYGQVSVAALYDVIGVSCNYTDNDYGWYSLAGARAVRLSNGWYTIEMPQAQPLRR